MDYDKIGLIHSDLVRIEPEAAGEYPHRIVPKDTVSAAKLRGKDLDQPVQ